MTVPEILQELKPKKPLSRAQLYVHLRRLKIKPIGARQIPAQYPQDTPHRILLRLGIVNGHLSVTPKLTKSRR
jgi:hypothetical protein